MKPSDVAWLAAALLAGCGGSASQTASPPTVDITGSWTTPPGPTSPGRMWQRLNQAAGDAHVEGTFVSDSLETGNLAGTVEGALFRFRMVVTNPGCPGEIRGSADAETDTDPPTMTVSYSGSTTCGGALAGAVLFAREDDAAVP
jgi:hypothetical protein